MPCNNRTRKRGVRVGCWMTNKVKTSSKTKGKCFDMVLKRAIAWSKNGGTKNGKKTPQKVPVEG